MSEIILDNLGLGVACSILNKQRETLNKEESICWQQLLTAIILWDDVYYLSSNRKSINIEISNIFRVYEEAFGLEKLDEEFVLDEFRLGDIEVDKSILRFNNADDSEAFNAYTYASSLCSADILFHPNRMKVFEKSGILKAFNALKLFKYLDKEAQKYIEKSNADLETSDCIEIPLLYGFIRKNTSSLKDELVAAKELHSHKDVVAFRKEIDKLKESIDFSKRYRATEQVKNILDEIINTREGATKKSLKTKLSVGLTPKFDPEKDFVLNLISSIIPSAKLEKEWSEEIKCKPEFNFIFIDDVAKYGLVGESKPIYLN